MNDLIRISEKIVVLESEMAQTTDYQERIELQHQIDELQDELHEINTQVLNIYGDPATHRDCTHYYEGKCSGEMVWWTNPNTGNSMTMCAHHAQKADDRQYKIKAEYLHDGIHDEDY